MATYEDVYNTSKTTEDIHNTMAVTYEMMSEKGIDDPETELTDEDHTAVREHLKSVIPELQGFLDNLTGHTTETPQEDAGDDEEPEPDDVVRIVLNIPAAHLSAEERVQLERDMVREAAEYSSIWMQTKEFRMADSPDVNENEEHEEAVDNLVSEVDLPPDEVIADIEQKFSETYEQMRVDYDEDFTALQRAVFECLIEDGYIAPGPHYNVDTETVEFMNGDKMSFVTGPKGSKTVKKEKK